ncbi:MAG: DUF3099 domain-containing protein [Mycobacteriales bacterium]
MAVAERRRNPDPVVVTSAYQNRDEERDSRRKRYAITMLTRIVLIAVSVAFLRPWPWALYPAMLLATVLPYVAVVLANGSNRKAGEVTRFDHRDEVAAIGSGHRTIDPD